MAQGRPVSTYGWMTAPEHRSTGTRPRRRRHPGPLILVDAVRRLPRGIPPIGAVLPFSPVTVSAQWARLLTATWSRPFRSDPAAPIFARAHRSSSRHHGLPAAVRRARCDHGRCRCARHPRKSDGLVRTARPVRPRGRRRTSGRCAGWPSIRWRSILKTSPRSPPIRRTAGVLLPSRSDRGRRDHGGPRDRDAVSRLGRKASRRYLVIFPSRQSDLAGDRLSSEISFEPRWNPASSLFTSDSKRRNYKTSTGKSSGAYPSLQMRKRQMIQKSN